MYISTSVLWNFSPQSWSSEQALHQSRLKKKKDKKKKCVLCVVASYSQQGWISQSCRTVCSVYLWLWVNSWRHVVNHRARFIGFSSLWIMAIVFDWTWGRSVRLRDTVLTCGSSVYLWYRVATCIFLLWRWYLGKQRGSVEYCSWKQNCWSQNK